MILGPIQSKLLILLKEKHLSEHVFCKRHLLKYCLNVKLNRRLAFDVLKQ